MNPAGFWGLSLESDKTYSQQVDESFCITMAALGAEVKGNAKVSVIASYSDKKFTLCSLTPGKIEQQPLNLSFLEGEEVTFSLAGGNGKASVDLTGNYIMPMDDGMDSENGYDGMMMDADGNIIDEELDSELEGNEEAADWEDEADQVDETVMAALSKKMGIKADSGKITEIKSDEEEVNEDDEEEEEGDSDEESLTEEEMKELTDKMMEEVAKEQGITVEELKSQLSELNEDDEDEEDEEEDEEEEMEEDDEDMEEVEETPAPKSTKGGKQEPKKQAKAETPKKEAKAEVAKKEVKAEASKKEAKPEATKKEEPKTESKAKKLPSGLIIEDIKVGNGPRAKNGKKVGVRYIGKLASGKVFDSNTKGAPFVFRVGGGEVIKGWDVGVSGMNVGGTRKLTIPPALAYGSKGAPPDIPKNAVLEFEVKLLEVKNN